MLSFTVVHLSKAVGRNEMPFDRDSCVVPSNIVLDRGPGPLTGRGDLGEGRGGGRKAGTSGASEAARAKPSARTGVCFAYPN